MNAETLRIALLQCESLPDDVDGNLGRLEAAAVDSAAEGADLLITPEMFATGYNIDAATARRLADPVSGGPLADAVSGIARRTGIAILYGCAELSADDHVYNTVRLVDASGRQLAAHHKTQLFGEIDRAAVSAGAEPPAVVDLDGWSLGLLICYEVEFPELARRLAVDGIDVLCVPTANMPEYDAVQTILLPARGLENQIAVAYANYCGTEGDLAYGGLSELIGPDGMVLARAGREPELVIAEIRQGEIAESRRRFPYLADRRPEMY